MTLLLEDRVREMWFGSLVKYSFIIWKTVESKIGTDKYFNIKRIK